MLFAVLTLGSEVALLDEYPYFDGPDWLCRAVHYGQVLPLYASPFLLVAISADRYQAICRPLDNFRRSRYWRPNLFAAGAWSLAIIFSIPQIFVWKLDSSGHCITLYGQRHSLLKYIYILWFNTIAWLLPSILATFFYFKVCKAVWMSHRPELLVDSGCSPDKHNYLTQDYVDRLRKASCGYRRQNSEFDRKRTQTVRLTMTIIALNFVLWTPFCVCNVLQAFWPHILHPSVNVFLGILGNLNSCVNPWIYILFNFAHARRAFLGHSSRACPKSETEQLHSAGCSARPTQTLLITNNNHSSSTAVHLSGDNKLPLKGRVKFEETLKTINGALHGSFRQPRAGVRPISRESL